MVINLNDSNDWNTHSNLLSITKKFDKNIIIQKGIYDSGFDIDHYIYLEDNVLLPVEPGERKYLKVVFYINNKACKLKIYFKNDEITCFNAKLVHKYEYDNLETLKELVG